ncbi:hypothetical protein DFH09DRAFT_1420242 [Mycena vulgaris]|nr:hypothetical protein DFH09DRAFT_1420242 [Mycena vulgaris]
MAIIYNPQQVPSLVDICNKQRLVDCSQRRLIDICWIVALISCTKLLGVNPLKACKVLLAALISFYFDILSMAVYAILMAFALCTAFLALTTLHPIFSPLYPIFRVGPAVSHWRFPFEFFNIFRAEPPQPQPQRLSSRWITHTWDVLHVIRPRGTAPAVLFLSFSVPALLLCLLRHQRRQDLKIRKAEILKYLSAEQVMIAALGTWEEHSQPVDEIRSALKCGICSGPYSLPYTLAPCGHTFDLLCLRRSFRAAPSPPDSRLPLPRRKKFCPLPTCGAEVRLPPALAWTVKTVADAVADASTDEDAPPVPTYPWAGIFDAQTVDVGLD